ncbi:hypothetical protein EJB05_16241, partial [Eragrostis curvula]
LGTYDTHEEAACAYDAAYRTLRPRAKMKFPEPAGEEETRLAAMLAHFAGVKRKREEKLNKEARRKMDIDILYCGYGGCGCIPPRRAAASYTRPSSWLRHVRLPACAGSQTARVPVGVSFIRLFGVDVVLAPAPLDVGFPQPIAPPFAPPAPAPTLPHFAIGETPQGSGNGPRSWCA